MPAYEYINPTSLDARLEAMMRRVSRGVFLDLDVERRLALLLGNPERAYPSIHVAGTNGKGSICAFLSSIFRQAHHRVGLYTSPHLIHFNERIQIDGVSVSNDELVAVMKQLDGLIGDEEQALGRLATFFEYVTAVAFECFRRHQVDLAILETGLGGRLDATNVVDPEVSVIASVSMDHADYLGDSLAGIAAEKGGIIKPGKPVVVARQNPEVLSVLRKVANEQHAPLSDASEDVRTTVVSESWDGTDVRFETDMCDYGIVHLPVPGWHQIDNAAAALRAVELTNDVHASRVTLEQVKLGFERMVWPGRLQVLSRKPLTVLDCAHNADAGLRLAETLNRMAQGRTVGLVVGMCRDKDVKSFLNAFSKVVKTCWPVTLRTNRSLSQEEWVTELAVHEWTVRPLSLRAAIEDARDWASRENGIVCVAGSIYLAGELLELLERDPLNE